MSEESTAVSVRNAEIESIREQGGLMVARQKELNAVTKMLEGVQWGNVKGSSLSAQTRYAVARICDEYGADPLLHIHILSGNVYLNAQYWAEQINALPGIRGWHQNNISASYVAELREQAAQAMKDAKEFDAPELRAEGLDLLAKARQANERRAFYGIPDGAAAAYETVIEFHDREPVREANYAPNGTNDPVGKARPAETARSRSMRRAGAKASPRIRSIDELAARQEVRAEFRVIREDEEAFRASLPTPDGPQAVRIGAGEPEATRPVEAQPLPVQDGNAPPRVHANARKEKEKFEEGCRVFGIDDVRQFTTDVLEHDCPASLEDYQELNLALAKLMDGGEQGSLV